MKKGFGESEKRVKAKKDKKGQVTLFIIIGIVILGAVVGFVLLRKPILEARTAPEKIEVRECVESSVENALNIILRQGGYANPQNYYMYKGNKVAFLCYNKEYYKQCINQEPLYIEHLEKEIKGIIDPKVRDCFFSLEQDYKDRGYAVTSSPLNLAVLIEPERIRVLINKTITLNKGGETKKFDKFDLSIVSNLYGLARTAIDIVDQEARLCSFEYIGYMLVHPEFDITKNNLGTEVSVYNVKEKKTNKELNLAIRSCAQPPNGA
jgi:hypothetical protein